MLPHSNSNRLNEKIRSIFVISGPLTVIRKTLCNFLSTLEKRKSFSVRVEAVYSDGWTTDESQAEFRTKLFFRQRRAVHK